MAESVESFKVGLVQHAAAPDREENLRRTVAGIEDAAARGANVICTQELFLNRYFCHTQDPALFDLAEPIPGATTRELGLLAKQLGVVIIASLFEKRSSALAHNTAAIIGTDGELLGIYRKMHIPQDPGFEEKFYFTPGDTGFHVFDTPWARVGVLICWDQWFPEGARLAALQGAEVLFYPTAIGWQPFDGEALGRQQHQAWETVQRGHAIANGCYVCAGNRVGTEGEGERQTQFWGQSFVCDPYGTVEAKASADAPEVLVSAVDLTKVRAFRRIWPFFRDRRIDAYGNLTRLSIDQP